MTRERCEKKLLLNAMCDVSSYDNYITMIIMMGTIQHAEFAKLK